MRERLNAIKGVFGYLGCICITVGVAYFIDGTAGVILTAALICALVLSLALTLSVKRFIRVDISVSSSLMNKGEQAFLLVKLSKKIILPAPVVRIKAAAAPQLELTESRIYNGSVAGKEITQIKIPFKAKHFGKAVIGIERLTLTDFLGIFRFNIPLDPDKCGAEISVYPDIPDTGVQIDLLKTATQFSGTDDDEEETEETAVGSSGTPGYEHRQYYPGDPIKKINWKLSSKRDIYMVRLDEKTCAAGQLFFLDCPPVPDGTDDEACRLAYCVRDNVAEGALAMMTMLVREGREAEFFFFNGGLWQSVDIRANADVLRLQEQLASLEPLNPPQLIPSEITASGKTPICFTSAAADNAKSAAAIVSQCPDLLLICAADSGLQNISPNLWTVSTEFEFKKQTD